MLLQSPQLYHKHVDRDYRDGERVYSRLEIERMYQERERAYHRAHPDQSLHPRERPPGYSGPAASMYREVRDRGERFYVAVQPPPPPHHAYPNHPSGAGYHAPREVYYQQRPGGGGAYAEQRLAGSGGGGGYIQAKRELHDDPDGKAFDAERENSYPTYPGPGRFRQGFGGSEDGGPPPPPGRDGRMQHSPGLSSHARNGVRSVVGDPASVAAAAAVAVPPSLYNTTSRQAGPIVEGGSYHHHPHARGRLDGGGSSRHSSPPGSPRAHSRRGSDEASPLVPPSLRRNGSHSRSGGSAVSLPPAAAAAGGGRGGPAARGGGVSGVVSVDVDRNSASRSDSKPPMAEEDGVSGDRKVGSGAGGGEEVGGEKPFCEVVRDSSGVTRLFIPENPPVVPRRPPSKGNKRETLGDIAHRIPVSVMRPYFNYPLRTAAEVRRTGQRRVAVGGGGEAPGLLLYLCVFFIFIDHATADFLALCHGCMCIYVMPLVHTPRGHLFRERVFICGGGVSVALFLFLPHSKKYEVHIVRCSNINIWRIFCRKERCHGRTLSACV